MMREYRAGKGLVVAVLLLQVIPLLLFPPDVFNPTTQEWWLPALLALLVLIADVQLIVRGTAQLWPWYLMSFAQGFNIISRLMMIWSHTTSGSGASATFNVLYIGLTLLSIALSAFVLTYVERAEVRLALLRG